MVGTMESIRSSPQLNRELPPSPKNKPAIGLFPTIQDFSPTRTDHGRRSRERKLSEDSRLRHQGSRTGLAGMERTVRPEAIDCSGLESKVRITDSNRRRPSDSVPQVPNPPKFMQVRIGNPPPGRRRGRSDASSLISSPSSSQRTYQSPVSAVSSNHALLDVNLPPRISQLMMSRSQSDLGKAYDALSPREIVLRPKAVSNYHKLKTSSHVRTQSAVTPTTPKHEIRVHLGDDIDLRAEQGPIRRQVSTDSFLTRRESVEVPLFKAPIKAKTMPLRDRLNEALPPPPADICLLPPPPIEVEKLKPIEIRSALSPEPHGKRGSNGEKKSIGLLGHIRNLSNELKGKKSPKEQESPQKSPPSGKYTYSVYQKDAEMAMKMYEEYLAEKVAEKSRANQTAHKRQASDEMALMPAPLLLKSAEPEKSDKSGSPKKNTHLQEWMDFAMSEITSPARNMFTERLSRMHPKRTSSDMSFSCQGYEGGEPIPRIGPLENGHSLAPISSRPSLDADNEEAREQVNDKERRPTLADEFEWEDDVDDVNPPGFNRHSSDSSYSSDATIEAKSPEIKPLNTNDNIKIVEPKSTRASPELGEHTPIEGKKEDEAIHMSFSALPDPGERPWWEYTEPDCQMLMAVSSTHDRDSVLGMPTIMELPSSEMGKVVRKSPKTKGLPALPPPPMPPMSGSGRRGSGRQMAPRRPPPPGGRNTNFYGFYDDLI